MKNSIQTIALFLGLLFIASCEKDEGKLPNISFKTGGSYIATDVNAAGGSTVMFGINSSKAEKKDVLKKFAISKSINGGTATTVYSKDLSKSEEDDYSYDFSETLETTVGQTNKYTFTITNRDGLVNQVSATVTIQ